MGTCNWRLVVGGWCDESEQCRLDDGHDGSHEFAGWLVRSDDGYDDWAVIVQCDTDNALIVQPAESAGGQRSGSEASAPPGRDDEEVLDALDPGFAAMYAEHKAQRGES